MGRVSLRARLLRLEKATDGAGLTRVALYGPARRLPVRPQQLADRVMWAPDWGTDDEWQTAALAQQRKLVEEVNESDGRRNYG